MPSGIPEAGGQTGEAGLVELREPQALQHSWKADQEQGCRRGTHVRLIQTSP